MPFVIDIFGSCISRDILENCNDELVVPGTYVARSSFASAMQAPCDYSPNEKCALSSSFQKRVLNWDIEKTGIEQLATNPGDYLMIDFFEERFPLVRFRQSIVTMSREFEKSGFEHGEKIVWRSLSDDLDGKAYGDMFESFLQRILDIYPMDRIIINRAFLTKYYIRNDGIVKPFSAETEKWIDSINLKMKALYDAAESAIPSASIIDLTKHFIGSERNKWGLDSAHYEERFYTEAAQFLEHLLRNERPTAFEKLKLLLYDFIKSARIHRQH